MEEADGQQELGQGHEGLGGEGGPGGACGTETGDEDEVDDDIEEQAGGSEDIELAQVSAGGEESAEDIGDGDGDEAEDDHAEGRHIKGAAAGIEEVHQRFGPYRANHRNTHSKYHQGPEDKTQGVL